MGGGKKKKIETFLVTTNNIASRPPETPPDWNTARSCQYLCPIKQSDNKTWSIVSNSSLGSLNLGLRKILVKKVCIQKFWVRKILSPNNVGQNITELKNFGQKEFVQNSHWQIGKVGGQINFGSKNLTLSRATFQILS